MLSRWLEGEPVRYRTSAVLNGLYLNETLEPLPGRKLIANRPRDRGEDSFD